MSLTSLRHDVPSLVRRLAAYGERPALVGDAVPGGSLSYADLAARVAAVAETLGTRRRLVLVEGANELTPLVTYLGALAAGCPVLLVAGGHVPAALMAAYDPDVVLARDGDEWMLAPRREETVHDLHPDLALLLSTSGSTGSPQLVRLSHADLVSNAAAIASYLDLRDGDVAATTLPMHYCYGLSVVHSHLYAGAALMLTSESVLEPAFWEAFARHHATSLAGVPYTFELLDRVGFADLDLPHLRTVTQAGGRLAPDDVRRYAELGQRRGWDLFVMYGQTEATARMAYLPPDRAHERPESIGIAIPGGELRLEPLPERPLETVDGTPVEVGELVYRGDNVMLGYADSAADLGLGRIVTELYTGDVARRAADGLYEVVGRRSRIAKVFGLRIDLDHVERVLAARGILASATASPAGSSGGGDRLVLAVGTAACPVDEGAVQAVVREQFGLPPTGVRVLTLSEVPRLPSGKTDYRAVVALAEAPAASYPPAALTTDTVVNLFAVLLGRSDARAWDSFVSLGGDSLSYVETSLRLEALLGRLPSDWHLLPADELAHRPAERPADTRDVPEVERQRGTLVETNVLLRALAIVGIVATHANLFTLTGGAHLLLGIVGFNFARFQITSSGRSERLRATTLSLSRVVVPSVLWIGAAATFTPGLGWRSALLVNGIVGTRDWSEPAWHYWFIEALVYLVAGSALLLAVPGVAGLERRWPFALPVLLSVAALATRYDLVSLRGGDEIHRAHVVLWLFALGWAAARSRTVTHRALLSLLVVATVPGFFDDPAREAFVAAGLLALVWVPLVRVPRVAARACGVLAGASLWIYLVHWQVYPHLEDDYPFAATLLSLAAGVLAWRLADLVTVRRGGLEIGERRRWFTPGRPRKGRTGETEERRERSEYDGDVGRAGAARRDDQPAHLAPGPARNR